MVSVNSDHEYEPVGGGLLMTRMALASETAPVVRIIDTDIVPVADSDDDDGINIRGRFTPGPQLDDIDLILPLDGKIEDCAMEARELGSGGETSDEIETVQQLQDRIEERFLNNPTTPCTESRTDAEINTSQVDSSVMEELPLRRGARGFPQRLRSQADKLRTRFKSIQRPNFNFPIDRNKTRKSRSLERSTKSSDKIRSKFIKRSKITDKFKSKSSEKSKTSDKSKASDKSKTSDTSVPTEEQPKTTEKQSRIQKIRSSLPERPKFSFPDKSKFHLPERPKINLPHFPKFPNKPNFHMPTLPRRRAPSLTITTTTTTNQTLPTSNETTAGSKKNIFDFSTIPRFFDRKKKQNHEYTTSSPKDSRAESSESATFPRVKKSKSFSARWTQRFTDLKFGDDDNDDKKQKIDYEKPWIHPSQEKPRLSLRPQESLDDSEQLPWEGSEGRQTSEQREELSYEDEIFEPTNKKKIIKKKLKPILRQQSSESYEHEMPQIDPRIYGDQDIRRVDSDVDTDDLKDHEDFKVSFEPVDPRRLKKGMSSEEEEEEEIDEEEQQHRLEDNLSSEMEDESMRSDREQQASSGSSCDRRRRGVIETIDSDEFFLRAKGISQDDMHVGRYLTSEIRDALRAPASAQEVIILDTETAPTPPQRPMRTRSLRKRKESSESSEAISINHPKRQQRRSQESDLNSIIGDNDDSYSEPRHRIVYHTESVPMNLSHEPLDDIIVIKPIRRKSKSSLRSTSQLPIEIIPEIPSPNQEQPPIIPRRRKRIVKEITNLQQNGICNDNEHIVEEIFQVSIRPKSEPPIKPARYPSREVINTENKMADGRHKMENDEIDFAPIPPSRRSRSRGTSIAQDDDRTSRGAESISDIAYADDDEIDNDSKLDYSSYALIDRKEKKPPRPPPPRRQRDKFATAPRPSKRPPLRPERAYTTLKARSRTPSFDKSIDLRGNSMPYLNNDLADDADQKDLLSGEVLSKMAGRPLPAPPRPPRARRHKMADDNENTIEGILDDLSTEAYASTQTDPLPDDLIIEEVTQAKLIMTPSRDGSQVFVSTERIPSPQYKGRFHNAKKEYLTKSTKSEPDIRQSRASLDDYKTPEVPPLPIYDETPQRPPRTRSHSLSVPKEISNNNDTDNRAAMIEALEERLSSILTNETLRIGSLEVGDLRVDKLNVSEIDAHKIVASEIDAIVVSVNEMKNSSDTNVINPALLKELIAIKSQLEQVALQSNEIMSHTISESPSKIDEDSKTDSTVIEKKTWNEMPKLDQLQLEPLSRRTETRAIYSTQGISQSPVPEIFRVPRTEEDASNRDNDNEKNSEKIIERSVSRSRSSSPGRTNSSRLRQTASPVKSLPPVISVTPDSPDDTVYQKLETTEAKPQRAKISYTNDDASPNTTRPSSPQSLPSSPQSRPSSPQTRPSTPPIVMPLNQQSIQQQQQQQFIAFQTSQIPSQFFTLATPGQSQEPSIIDMTQQLLRALQLIGTRAIRHLVNYVLSRVRLDESEAKIREVELAFCALLLIIAGLLIVCFAGPRTITHHHHWDYFNPPRL